MLPRVSLRRRSLAAASAAALLALTPPAAHAQFSSLTFFGDSFTDMGMADVLVAVANSHGLSVPDPSPAPPYWPGPAPFNFPGTNTDGPTWASYFASALGRPGDALPAMDLPGFPTGNNFAISGARTGALGTGGFPIGLLTQLGLFGGVSPLPGVIPAPAPRAIDPTGLYVVWAGVNDIRDFADAPPANPLLALQNSVANVFTAANALAAAGARSFLIPLAPNSSVVPEVALNPAVAALRNSYTALFNDLLGGAIGELRDLYPTARFSTFDLSDAYARIVADAATGGTQYGITNLTTPCFLNYGTPAQIPCDVSLFSDGLHPTTRAQQVVASVALAAVPEPATVVLVAGGLAALALGARRRARRG